MSGARAVAIVSSAAESRSGGRPAAGRAWFTSASSAAASLVGGGDGGGAAVKICARGRITVRVVAELGSRQTVRGTLPEQFRACGRSGHRAVGPAASAGRLLRLIPTVTAKTASAEPRRAPRCRFDDG